MPLDLVNPFDEVVIIGKRYKIAVPPQGSTVIAALTPTGRHVSHANALHHTRNSKGGGGRATRLERYTGGHGGRKKGVHVGKSLAGGLEQLGKIPKVKKVPTAPKNFLGGSRPDSSAASDASGPSVFSLKRTSGKAIAGGAAGTGAASAFALSRRKGDDDTASKAFGALPGGAAMPAKVIPKMSRPAGPVTPKAPLAPRAPVSALNSNMPAGARTGRRLS